MDSAMRDLERIREQDDDAPSRKLAMLVMAALSTVGLVFAMGVLLRDSGAEGQPERDPLARLDALDAELRDGGSEPTVEEEPEVELTFHAALTRPSDPELAAAIAAADAELAALDRRDSRPARTVALALSGERPNAPAAAPQAPPSDHAAPAEALDASAEETDPADGEEAAREGYALQVASYKHPNEAETFANDLERRGYPVFIERAVIDGRGEFHRVRIGPMPTRGAALRERARFEEAEQIHTLLVKL